MTTTLQEQLKNLFFHSIFGRDCTVTVCVNLWLLVLGYLDAFHHKELRTRQKNTMKKQIPGLLNTTMPISTYCSNRSDHVFWDLYHPTQATAHIFVDTIFDGSSQYTLPINPLVPAVFLFGDSLFDVGNNNFLISLAKADLPHHGIDFPTKKPTGRFSNGKHCADFIAEKVGFQTSPPPYLSLVFKKNKASLFMNGVNFASSAAGIFNETLPQLGDKIPLSKQVEYYATVYEELVKELGSSAAQHRLSKSLFVLEFGTTDLASYALTPEPQIKYTRQQYVNLMSSTLKGQLKRLYNYGARKFVLPGLGPVGCMPGQRVTSPTDDCNEESNHWAVKYNEELQLMLQELKSELHGFSYTYLDSYTVLQNIIQNPTPYGFTKVKAACCGLGRLNAMNLCLPISSYCSNRNEYVFWDMFHPSEATARIFVNTFFNSPSQYAFPISVRQLIAI
ncbi:hypothetical protein ACOSQ2_030686 [Xanthoceras sorbifolium]